MKRAIVALGLAAALGLGLAACGDDDDELTAEQQYCTDLTQLETDITALADLDPTTVSIEDLEDARDAIKDDLDDLAESASAVGEEQVSGVNDAVDNLEQSIDDLSGDESLSEAFNELAPDVSAVFTALESLEAVNCDDVEVETSEE